MSKRTRRQACKFAAQVMAGEGMSGDIGARLFSLVVFFENYIDEGADRTVEDMGLLVDEREKRFRVIAGGALRTDT